MAPIFAAIADDFTGAADLAGLLARSGARVSLRIGVPEGPVDDVASFEVIALKIRTVPVKEAVGEARKAMQWLQAAGFQRFFWKYCSSFDSTKEGNIGPVAEALMAELGQTQTIYCPAFPENGRAIFMGHLFIGRQPLAESPMKDHPLTPMRDSDLTRLLAAQVTKPVGLVDRLTVAQGSDALRQELATLKDEGVAHVVVDAVANQDLEIIANACQDMPLLTGGSAVAMPLPDIYKQAGLSWQSTSAEPWTIPEKGALILSGSCSAMTRTQVAQYLKHAPGFRLDPLDLSENGPQNALDWLAAQPKDATPIVYATAEPDEVKRVQSKLGTAQAGDLVEGALARIATFARDTGTRRFVVAGGETSGAVTTALGVSRLNVGPEIAPGVPWTFCKSNGVEIALGLKSGNFGSETFFEEALNMLDQS